MNSDDFILHHKCYLSLAYFLTHSQFFYKKLAIFEECIEQNNAKKIKYQVQLHYEFQLLLFYSE